MLAISHFSNKPQAYSAHPFVISGSCKREDVLSQQRLLENARDVLADKQDIIGGRLYCITSDGDARRRRALSLFLLSTTLEPSDPVRKKLGELRLFNYRCGRDGVTPDIEYKHIMKRLRSSLLRSAGCKINGRLINQEILRDHLQATTLAKHRIDTIVDPSDKQDVKLMYDLLSAIAILPAAAEDDPPPIHNTRTALQLLGKLYTHLLEAYTNIHLSLSEQLQHLSAIAHLVMAIYRSDKGDSMPSQTYYDLMTAIKNAFFCVAKTQVDNPDGDFWLILIGTDALERLFGKIRTMIGNDSNVDQLQLANRAESAAMCTSILAEHPEWEKAPRRLTLKAWREQAGDLSARVDHINPASWGGDARVRGVVLLTCWEEGRRIATAELKCAGYDVPFQGMDSGFGYDLLCPFGENNMVLLGHPTEGEREDDDEEVAMIMAPRTAPAAQSEHQPHPTHAPETNLDTHSASEVLEELAETELSRLSGALPKPKYDGYVTVNSTSGKEIRQHKSSVCRIYSEPLTVRDSRERLERVRGFPRSAPSKGVATAFGVEAGEPAEPGLTLQDPVAVLVRSKDFIWLAVAEIYGIKQGSTVLNHIPTRLLGDPNVRTTARIMCLSSRSGTPDNDGEWEWFGPFEKTTIEVEGRWLQPLNPAIIRSTRTGSDDVAVPGYAFDSGNLIDIATTLYGNLKKDLDRMPSVPWSESFPYRLPNGVASFTLLKRF